LTMRPEPVIAFFACAVVNETTFGTLIFCGAEDELDDAALDDEALEELESDEELAAFEADSETSEADIDSGVCVLPDCSGAHDTSAMATTNSAAAIAQVITFAIVERLCIFPPFP
ncbi:hypothetical protein RCJ22_04000, partial [Vibrio sp. FNV 38]|nr:hypothetical protein [Vibrio sp. FNV 38]